MTARWHVGPITGVYFWWVLVTSPEILVFLFFMITDPKTAPRPPRARSSTRSRSACSAALLIAPRRTEFRSKVARARRAGDRLRRAAGAARSSRPVRHDSLALVGDRRARAYGGVLVSPAPARPDDDRRGRCRDRRDVCRGSDPRRRAAVQIPARPRAHRARIARDRVDLLPAARLRAAAAAGDDVPPRPDARPSRAGQRPGPGDRRRGPRRDAAADRTRRCRRRSRAATGAGRSRDGRAPAQALARRGSAAARPRRSPAPSAPRARRRPPDRRRAEGRPRLPAGRVPLRRHARPAGDDGRRRSAGSTTTATAGSTSSSSTPTARATSARWSARRPAAQRALPERPRPAS